MVFKTSSANQSGVVRTGPTCPIRTTDCAAPGLSIRYTVRAAARGGVGGLGNAGTSRRSQPPNRAAASRRASARSEEHTSELQSPCNLVCRLLLEKKKKKKVRC